MNYRAFRFLVAGSILSLIAAFSLLFIILLRGIPGTTPQLRQMVEQIAANQEKLISGSQQMGQLLDIPPARISQTPRSPTGFPGRGSSGNNRRTIRESNGISLL
ncbi:MAG: hypothetical protein AAF975_09235 [Spirochaetota bacterium]